MRWAAAYFLGYLIALGGLFAALWKLGIVQDAGGEWIAIGVAIALGIMSAASAGGQNRTIEIDRY